MLREELEKKAQAVFLGLAIGDALGATTEFMTPGEIRARYKVHQKIRGGGWLGIKPGQVTDDTEMSLAMSRALVAAGGWDLQGIAEEFLAWMRSKPIADWSKRSMAVHPSFPKAIGRFFGSENTIYCIF